MKPCKNCGNMIADDATHCYACNTTQTPGFEEFEAKPHYSDTFLKVLCILTILGAGISIISAIVTLASGLALPIENMKMITYVGLALASGKLTGAILMLTKKLIGLYIYTAVALLGLAVQLYSVFITSAYTEKMMAGGSIFVYISTAISFIFLVAFIVMYWLPVNRRHLS